jgi:hypothetical protein
MKQAKTTLYEAFKRPGADGESGRYHVSLAFESSLLNMGLNASVIFRTVCQMDE